MDKLRGTVEGKNICLVGSPGVGKTSIGKSIARALGRRFFLLSVGGLTISRRLKGIGRRMSIFLFPHVFHRYSDGNRSYKWLNQGWKVKNEPSSTYSNHVLFTDRQRFSHSEGHKELENVSGIIMGGR